MTDPLASAAAGPAIETELVSLTGLGSMFVDYDWVTQEPATGETDVCSVVCGPAGAGVRWTIKKEWDSYLELEPTLSAPITVVLGAVMSGSGLLLVTLGVDDGSGRFYGVDPNGQSQASSSGTMEYLVYQDAFEADPRMRYWLMKDPHPLQPGLQVAGAADVDDATLAAALASAGLASDSAAVAGIRRLLTRSPSLTTRRRRAAMDRR